MYIEGVNTHVMIMIDESCVLITVNWMAPVLYFIFKITCKGYEKL